MTYLTANGAQHIRDRETDMSRELEKTIKQVEKKIRKKAKRCHSQVSATVSCEYFYNLTLVTQHLEEQGFTVKEATLPAIFSYTNRLLISW